MDIRKRQDGENFQDGKRTMRFAVSREELLKIDNLVLYALGVLACTFGYLSFSPPSLSVQEAKGERIAEISSMESSVKRKSSEGLSWDDASTSEVLYGGDQIFTDKASNATVKFKDGSEIAVAENSLIKIEQKNGKTTIDMSKGFVSGKFADENSNFAIKMGGTNVKLEKGAEIQVKIDPNNKSATKIALISGNANIDSGSGAMSLKKDQLLSVDAKTGATKIEEIDLKLQEPAPGAKIDDTAASNLTFKWQSALKDATYELVIARDPLFKSLFLNKQTKGKALTIPLPDGGNYYWRVNSISSSGKKDQSVELQFTINKMASPDLIAPIGGKKFQYEEGSGKPLMSFIWKAVPGAGGYEIEVSKSKSFADKILVKEASLTNFDTKELEAGTYYWRVRAKSASTSKFGSYSIIADFVLLKLSVPEPPVLVAPANDSKIKPDQALALSWNESESASGYQIQISRSKSFDNTAVSSILNNTSFSWNPEGAGVYYWRVKAIDKFERDTKYSAFRKMTIDAAVPQLVAPETNAEILLTTKDMKINFQWLATPGAESYRFELASDAGFNKVKSRKKTSANETKIENLSAGIYFWRVKAIIPGGAETDWSNSRGFSMQDLELLPAPVLKDRYYFKLPAPSAGTAFIIKFLDFITLTETAKAQDAEAVVGDDSKVSITWKAIDDAINYYIELATDKSFEDIVVKRRSTAPTFNWPEAKAGKYWLRAAAVDQLERKGKFSRIAEVIVNFKAPYLVEPSDSSSIQLDLKKKSIDFTWQSVKNGRYTLEISKKSSFSDVVLNKQLSNNSFSTKGLSDGKYYWRVKAQYAPGLPAETSKTNSFSVITAKLPAPALVSPKPESIFKTEDASTEIKVALKKVPQAEAYEIEFAKDESFEKSVKKVASSEPETSVDLAAGTWYMRARAGSSSESLGEFGSVSKFKVKTLLKAPNIIAPKDGEEVSILGNKPRVITLSWSSIPKAETYTYQIASDDDFKKTKFSKTIDTTSTDVELGKGTYYLRVRAIDEENDKSVFSAIVSFEIESTELNAPELKFPDNGELLARRKAITLEWEKENGYDGYKLVLSRDKNFKKIVSEQEINKDSSTVELPKTGSYYWYVEGKNKKNQYAMRSDVQTFTISDYAATGRDRLRVIAGYAPSVISNSMVSDTINNSLSVAVFNSFMVNGQYWVSNAVGIEGAYHRKSTELYKQAQTTDTGGQAALVYAPQNFDLNVKYRKQLGTGIAVPEIQARAGYMYKTFYSFFAQNRTSLGLQESTTHNLTLGGGLKYPFSLSNYLEGWLDYASTLSSAPVTVSSGSHLMLDSRYYMMFPSRMNAGVGYRYANGTYQFDDEQNGVIGTLKETTHSIIGALGYGF